MLPIRFSLRAFFLMAALVAVICAWCVWPSIMARDFVGKLAAEDYQAADQMFRNADDRCLEKWDHKRWSFRASGRLAPITLGQLVRGQRLVQLDLNYMALDQLVSRTGAIVVTPLGANAPEVGYELYNSRIIDSNPETSIQR